jgi:hypothetical protein
MVKRRKNNTKKKRSGKGFKEIGTKARKIDASAVYETCTEQLSPFGGLLALIKFLDLIRFKEIFNSNYLAPRRQPKLGNHLMVVGILIRLRRTVYWLQSTLALYLYPIGCDSLRLFPTDKVTGGHYILALCRQLRH